jgi:hypothetical protein
MRSFVKYSSFFFLLILFYACQNKTRESEHQHDTTSTSDAIQPDTIKKSIPKTEHGQIGQAHLLIKYHAPAVRGRTIWGGLVPYEDVWVTGAHSATAFEINKNFLVNGQEISAGKYAIFTIPGKEKWIIIINKNWDQHLADEYDVKEDVIRLEVVPEQLENIQERLKYTITKESDTKGSISVAWEKIRVSFPMDIK